MELFDGFINCLIVTEKEVGATAKTKRKKAVVNIEFIDRGRSVKWVQLSGGEQDRMSLALLIALSQLQNPPFLMLDESFGSLNDDLREVCLDLLKYHCVDKIVLAINHEGTEGFYDQSILVTKS